MPKKLSKVKQEELDQLKELRLHITGAEKTSLVIYGGSGNITLHHKDGAKQNEGLFDTMLQSLEKKVEEKIAALES